MSNELRYTQYTYDEGIRLATEELRKQLKRKDEALKVATDKIRKLRDENNRLSGGESKHDKAMLVGRVDGLQMALNCLAAINGKETQ